MTTLPDNIIALGMGCTFAAALVKMTFTEVKESTTFDKKREAEAVNTIVATSSSNRGVRLALGSVYVYAAICFAMRWTQNARTGDSLLDPETLGTLVVAFGGVLLDMYLAGIWLTSGVDGQ